MNPSIEQIQFQEMSANSTENMISTKSQQERKSSKPQPQEAQRCPRCDSPNTKFCYYNNYSLTQPRYFCKSCRRYWTKGGTLRNIPVGGGCRKNKRSSTKKTLDPPLNFLQKPNFYDTNFSILGNPNGNFIGNNFSEINYGFGEEMKEEYCHGRENENRVLMGFPWQINGDGNIMGDVDLGFGSSWHGFLNNPSM